MIVYDLAVEIDGSAEHVRITLVTVQPQGITDHGEWLMGVLFLLRENAAQDGLNTEGWKDASGEAGGVNLFRSCATGKLIAGGRVAAQRGKGAGSVRSRCRSRGRSREYWEERSGLAEVISQQNQAVRIAERERSQQDAFDQ